MNSTFKCTFDKRFKILTIEDELYSLKFSNISTSYCSKVFPDNLENITNIETLSYDIKYTYKKHAISKTLEMVGSAFLVSLFNTCNYVLHMQKVGFSGVQSMSDTEIREAIISIPFDGAFDYYVLLKNFDEVNANHTYDITTRAYENSSKDYVTNFADLNNNNLKNIYEEINKLLNYLIFKHNSSNRKEFERRKHSSKVLLKDGETILRINNQGNRERKDVKTLKVGDSIDIDYLDERTNKDSYALGYEIDKIGKDYLEIIRKDNKCIRLKIRYDLIGEVYLEKEL